MKDPTYIQQKWKLILLCGFHGAYKAHMWAGRQSENKINENED